MITEATLTELRKTGISVIGDVPWGTHFCYFYETKEDLLETLVLYFKTGLESKEFCVWVVPQAVSVEEARHALGQAVPDLERHLAEGTLEIHSHDEWYLRDGGWDSQRVLQAWREKINHGSANGHVGLRAAGDAGWIQNEDCMAFREYENQVSAMIADQPSIILCTYPLTTSPGDQVFDVAHIHQVAVARRNGTWETIETPALKEAKAQIRRLNEELEQKVEERTKELAATNEALRAEIAERKLAEEAVKQAEDRIRLIIDTIPTMAWSLRPDGVLDFLNQRWLDYTGLSLQEAIEEPTRTVHPEDLPRVMEKWLAVKDTSEAYEDEMRLRRADGEYRWFLIRIAPLLDEQGNLLKRYGVSIDIEDRKRAEDSLQRAENHIRSVIDTTPALIHTGRPDGYLDYFNQRWLKYVGLSLEIKGWAWRNATLYASQMPALVRIAGQGRPLNFNQRADFDLSPGDCAQILRVWLGRRRRLRRGVRGGAIHDDARGEISGVEIGISLLFLRHHFVDLVSKDAAHIRDQLRKRVGLRLATDCSLAGRSLYSSERCPRRRQRGHIRRRHVEVRERGDVVSRQPGHALGGLLQVAVRHLIQRRLGHFHFCPEIVVAILHRQRGKLIGNLQRLLFQIGSGICFVIGHAARRRLL